MLDYICPKMNSGRQSWTKSSQIYGKVSGIGPIHYIDFRALLNAFINNRDFRALFNILLSKFICRSRVPEKSHVK